MKSFAQAAGLPGFAQSKTYAAHRVWKGSSASEIKTTPLPHKEAWRLYKEARRFERQTYGHHESRYRRGTISTREGKLGRSALMVLQTLLFDFLDNKTGRLDPSYSAIARKACVSIATVGRALARLKEAGVLNWIPRCRAEEGPEGGFLLRQISNAFAVCPVGHWRGYRRPPDPPAPDAQAWGATPPLPSLGVAGGEGPGRLQIILEGSPPGSLGAALAKAGRRRNP